jgi:hypothetical protein
MLYLKSKGWGPPKYKMEYAPLEIDFVLELKFPYLYHLFVCHSLFNSTFKNVKLSWNNNERASYFEL